ncbi:MAG: efflux RND transporter periplasmic adaptor subunit [Planctomycetes bacterium]|nr:efflux RND transporter periplasmic adaptor subunit [Planctomycetota bacterium]
MDRPVLQKVNDYEDFAGRTEPVKVVELKSRVTGYLKQIHFKDGQDVEQGKQLFDIDDRIYKAELGKARAALHKAREHLKTTTSTYSLVKQAYESGSESKDKHDIAAGDMAEAAAEVEAQLAAVELAETNLRFCHITAPFDGRLSKRLVDEENLVKADETSLTTIVRLDEVYATFDIDERTVMRVRRLIQKGEVKSSRELPLRVQIALADEDDFSMSGVMVFTDNQVDAGTGTLRVRATITNPRLTTAPWYMLSPGMFVRVRVPIGTPRDAVLVPEKAIGSDQGQRFVFVVNAENTVERRNVRVGQQYGTSRVIEGNVVSPSDRVIVDGLLRVRPGAEVNPKPAPPPPPRPTNRTAITLPQAPAPHAKGKDRAVPGE